jgi:hypothetical protein
MSLATRSNTAARRSGGVLSSCRAGVRDSLARSVHAARRGGRAACVPRVASIQPGGARVPEASTQRLGPGLHPDGLIRTRICLSEGQRPLCEHHQIAERVKPREFKAQRKDHPMQHPRPLMRQRRTRQTLPATSAIAHRTLSTPHARATSCPMSTCRQVRR